MPSKPHLQRFSPPLDAASATAIGLRFADIKKLIGLTQRLVNAGSTVLVIEHNLDVRMYFTRGMQA